jgi:hypothetical protein
MFLIAEFTYVIILLGKGPETLVRKSRKPFVPSFLNNGSHTVCAHCNMRKFSSNREHHIPICSEGHCSIPCHFWHIHRHYVYSCEMAWSHDYTSCIGECSKPNSFISSDDDKFLSLLQHIKVGNTLSNCYFWYDIYNKLCTQNAEIRTSTYSEYCFMWNLLHILFRQWSYWG